MGVALAMVLMLGPPVLPPEPSASVPPPPPPAAVRTAALSRDIVDPFAGRAHAGGSVRSTDLRDPFVATSPPLHVSRVPTTSSDLVDPFADSAAPCNAATRQGVPIQRPRGQAPPACATSDAPLRDPFPRDPVPAAR